MQLRTLEDLEIEGKKVFLRLDLNVPIEDGEITDMTRIDAAIPTIKYILERTNKLVVATHLGRPKGKPDSKYTVEPVGAKLASLLNKEVVFVSDYTQEPASRLLDNIGKNQFVLLENLRFHPGEEKNNHEFAANLIYGFDFYVNDAFGTVHRAHASVTGCPEQLKPEQRAAGLLIQKEIDALSTTLSHPKTPFTVVMGGSKVSDKIAVILNLMSKCNNLLVGGAMAYTFLKFRGVDVGASKTEDDKMDMVASIYRNAEARKVNIELPVDHVAATAFEASATPISVNSVAMKEGQIGLDIGPRTIDRYSNIIRNSGTVLWNGPMGVFEWPAFANGSFGIARAMADCKGETIVGGGDSVSAVNKAGVADKISHISTGGGASLEFLEGKILPGLRVLAK